ncbi:EAL domain-containing protein, partial [Pseudomonas aeruginosa]|uniref:EAL domain-containing protein n=1 Tax=Pseudomonas aeruginosa TaxID=287 RepID=UPI002096364B
ALDSAQPGQARRYDPSGDREPLERRLLAASLGRAASRNELVLRLRPLTRAGQRQPLGAEALLYWQHPELGLIPPARLWPVARELEIEHALRDWLLAAACHAAASWPGGELPVLVVLSPAQCTHERLPERIAELLQQSG